MRTSLQVMIMTITVMLPAAFADDTAACRPDSLQRDVECPVHDADRDDTIEAQGQVVHRIEECTRIEKLLANPQARELIMQEPEGKRTVWWYAGNCPLGKSKG